jgi:UDP-glucose 4-epimerase
MRNVLVIGGSSFVAQNIIKYFSTEYKFKSVTRNSTGFINEIIINDYFDLDTELFQNVDIVINCTAIVHQPKIKDETIYNRVNYELSMHIAKLAIEAGVHQFLQLSTIAVYGSANKISIDTKECPNNPYGSSKLKADQELLKMSTDYFKVVCIRPPMVYGGGNAPGNMMRLIKLVDKKIPLPFGNANCKRDFIYIKTLVKYCQNALECNKSSIYIIKDSFSVSTKEIVELIFQKLEVRTPLFSLPNFFLFLIRKLKPSVFDKLFGKLEVTSNLEYSNYSRKRDIESGIAEMVNYYKLNRK